MINKERSIFKCCSNYDEIISFKYKKDDYISKRLIDYYYNFLFDDEIKKSNKKLIKLDDIMYLYITNKNFYYFLQNKFMEIETNFKDEIYYEEMIEEIFYIYNLYKEDVIVGMNTSVWL